MKLKKLELFGFKSFYDKTTFDFSDGITAIVGPNGCGKSNIVDAIRWVLGEHAPSFIRSKVLEDVIFAGSDAAGPLGMAEVTLTFSNEDGGGPPGYESYSEIQVTRRTFRDGESEFFINRIPSRLKDIAELFLDTGAGARGYAIIEQGRILSIVNARPEDKRLIIEEAAGVAKFRVRKKEAERKMESTRQNLARVRDIHEEVKRQLGGLDRQVRKAERYKALRDELKSLDLAIAARRRQALTAQAAGLAAERAEAEAELAAVRAGAANRESELEALRLGLAEADAALRDLRDACSALKEQIGRSEEERKGKIRGAEELRARIAETALEIAALESDIAVLAERVAAAEAEASTRESALSSLRDRNAELEAAAETAREEYRKAQELFERARSDWAVRVSLHSSARSSAESLRKLLEENERVLARLEERIAEAGDEAGRLDAELRAASERLAQAREALESAQAAWDGAGRRLDEVNARLDAVVETRRRAEGELAAADSRLSALSRLYGERDWTTSGVKAVLKYYRGENGSRESAGAPLGVMGELIETDAPYERAVEAVLGERVQSIVVRDHAEGLSALQYLKETREGRVSFVPVSLRRRDEEAADGGEEGVIAPLCDLVRAPAGCDALVRGFFGGTLLVRDIDCAVRLWNRNGVWNTYVTLEGDLVTADGILMGGAQETDGAGILAGKREIRELERETEELSAAAARARAEEEALRRERVLLEERREEMFRLREERGKAFGDVKQRHAVLSEAVSKAGGRIAELEQDREHHRAERERMTAELGTSEDAARETEEARGAEEERVRLLAAEVEAARGRMEEAREALNAAKVELAGLEQKDVSERTVLAGHRETLAGKRSALEERKARKASHEERSVLLAAEIEAGRAAIEQASMAQAARQEEIDRRLGADAEARASANALEQEIRESRKREDAGQGRLSDLRFEEQRIAMALSNRDDQVYQKYEIHADGLPLPEWDGEEELAAREARAEEIRGKMSAIGDVNLGAIEEHRELSERHAFLSAQEADLEKSLDDLAKAIQKINRTTRERFAGAFERINETFGELFPKLFSGGRAFLKLLDEEDLLETGVEIVAQPPGKKLQSLNLLSGGEKALTAIAFIFSIFLVKPSPFCLLDEVDAPLDDANIDRFNALVREMSANYQTLLITHNKRTMELADVLYGITMEKPGISKVVSVRFAA
ncbi:MAG: chromosome segregation protein SMC [Deltaproteobacteria bacterium]|nr:chromosome segregation protein SMC [Deltaproteobacteria bacterium]